MDSESEKCREQLGVFTDALDARDDWEIHSELFLVSMWFMLVSITLSFFSEVYEVWAKIQSVLDFAEKRKLWKFWPMFKNSVPV